MWEKDRVDGKRKLKFNAIPTIFPIIPTEAPQKVQTKINKNHKSPHGEIGKKKSSSESRKELQEDLPGKITKSENKLHLSRTRGKNRKRKQSLSTLEDFTPKIKIESSVLENISKAVVFDHCYTKINEQQQQQQKSSNFETQVNY